MRVFLSLLAPIFLSLIESSAGYSYSVSWGEDDESCTDTEEIRSLVAIGVAINNELEQDDLPQVPNWHNQVTHNGIRQLREETRGLRGLDECNHPDRCAYEECQNSSCYIMFNCAGCGYRRQLIQTKRTLTAEELQGELVEECETALADEGDSNGIGQYSPECKASMIAAMTCIAHVWD
jgi:hypothetical protein